MAVHLAQALADPVQDLLREVKVVLARDLVAEVAREAVLDLQEVRHLEAVRLNLQATVHIREVQIAFQSGNVQKLGVLTVLRKKLVQIVINAVKIQKIQDISQVVQEVVAEA